MSVPADIPGAVNEDECSHLAPFRLFDPGHDDSIGFVTDTAVFVRDTAIT
jgi:hypothetical protein